MVLQVEYDDFAAAVEKVLAIKLAFAVRQGSTTVVTAAKADKNAIVRAETSKGVAAVRNELQLKNIEVLDGEWRAGGGAALAASAIAETAGYIGAVAYKSREAMPGLWVEAFPHEPTNAEVLRAIFDEFSATGELEEVTFEEFVRLAQPNVLVLAPDDVAAFLRAKCATS